MELDKPVVSFAGPDEWEAWLEQHHETSTGVWIKMAKKASGIASIDWAGALQVALCFGWIDGQRRSFDETYFLQKFTPRTKRSPWSKINIGHVERLIAEGRMRPAGHAAIDAAKADGRWERAYASQSTIEVPADFQAALDARPDAAEFFATLSKSARYPFLYRIQAAKRPETRAKRIAEYTELLAEGKTLRIM
jgi:uncharacterized protein YdeI (YjbR/CyaY-like superfamily)